MSVFVDTSAWYAAADADDRSHDRARRHLGTFASQLVTTDHVLVETWFLAAARLGDDVAEMLISRILGGIAVVETADRADLEVAAGIGRAYPDQAFSIVDRTSWAVMQRLGVHEAIAFDADYAVYRFGPGRRRAFTVHA